MLKMLPIIIFSAIITIPGGILAREGGTLTGTITFEGTAPAKKLLKITKDNTVCGAEAHYDERLLVGENKGLQNVVVSILNAPAGKGMAALGSEFALHQTGCIFIPHIAIVPVGVPLQIYNDDGILHNIHTSGKKNRPVNIAQPKYRKIIKRKFRRPEIVPLKCDVHSWMKGYILVVDHPYHAVTNEKGQYTITGLPAGTYQVEVWHETLGKMQKEATIEAGASAKLDVVFKAAKSSQEK